MESIRVSMRNRRETWTNSFQVCHQLESGESCVTGVMIESNLVEGKQPEPKAGTQQKHDLVYGQSITDGCVGWDTTVEFLTKLNNAVLARRQKAASQ